MNHEEPLDILWDQASDSYRLIFPVRGGGQPSGRIQGRQQLIDVLRNVVGLHERAIEEAIKQVEKTGSASIPNVILSDEQRKQLGVLSPDEQV